MGSAAPPPPTGGSPRPAPVRELPGALCRGLTHFFTDIDDTLTSKGGLIPASSFSAMWDLADAGVQVVPVTGRPAGWCDHIARMWPVAGIIGENGAFTYVYDRARKSMRRSFSRPDLADPARHQRLAAVARRVLAEVPGTALAADQPFRLSDVAIDYCEDVPRLPPRQVDEICGILKEEGVEFKVSSIHVNFWLGGFDKMSGVRAFLDGQGLAFDDAARTALFIGDSPNDEPLFAGFPHSIAVGNLRGFLDRLTSLPRFITNGESAEGFVEAVGQILSRRAGRTANE